MGIFTLASFIHIRVKNSFGCRFLLEFPPRYDMIMIPLEW